MPINKRFRLVKFIEARVFLLSAIRMGKQWKLIIFRQILGEKTRVDTGQAKLCYI